jgi:adenylosuccinate synthase
MLSGVTKLIITKADVLDDFKILQVGVAYTADGVETKKMPYDLLSVDINPVYKEFAGWDTPISTCKTYAETPQSFKDYCSFVESYLQTKIEYISNGTGREQLLQVGK